MSNRIQQQAQESPNPTAADELLDLMRAIAHNRYCAGWLIDWEFNLWHAIHLNDPTNPPFFGTSPLHPYEVEALKHLSQECCGWWRWEDPDGEAFVSMPQWHSLLAERAKHQQPNHPTKKEETLSNERPLSIMAKMRQIAQRSPE